MTIPCFTAKQIADVLGVTKRGVLYGLESLPEIELRRVDGKPTKAWSLESLPPRLQEDLQAAARQRGFRNALEMLQNPAPVWQPPIPISEVADQDYKAAADLHKALLPSLLRQHKGVLTSAEFEALGCQEYQAVFRSEITDRRWRDIFKRTVERDGGRANWGNLELYLPEKPRRKIQAPPATASADDCRELHGVIASLGATPDEAQQDLLWDRVFLRFEDEVAAGKKAKQAKRSLVEFLERHASFLARSGDALRLAWWRNYKRWVDGGRTLAALDDRRAEKSGRWRAPESTPADLKLLTAAAAKLGGGIDQAWRELLDARKLSAEICDYYASSFKACPVKIRNLVKHDVVLEKISLHGPNAIKVNGAFVNRDPNGIAAGDWDQSDDMTMVNVWWEDTPEERWCGQGQLLVWIDERSWFIYSWDLISDRNYNGFSIRNSWTVKAFDWGIPRKGLYLERGIWKVARLVVGRPNDIDPEQTEMGIRRLGLRIEHARGPRAKVIERIYGLVQNYFQTQRGYVGRNPLTDRYELVQKQIALVKAGHEHPSKFFESKAQWMEILREVFLKFNNTPMGGKYHNGRSPKQVFEECYGPDKLMSVPEEYRYLLASNKIITTVGGNGISFQFGRGRFNYKNHETGRLRGQRVIAWFNPERPTTLCCTDLDGKKPFVVPLETSVYNHDPADGTLRKARSENDAHNSYQKELHSSLKPYYKSEFFQNLFRPTVVSPRTVETAQEFKRQEQVIEVRQKEHASRTRSLDRVAKELGIDPAMVRNATPEQAQGWLEMAEMMRNHKVKSGEPE